MSGIVVASLFLSSAALAQLDGPVGRLPVSNRRSDQPGPSNKPSFLDAYDYDSDPNDNEPVFLPGQTLRQRPQQTRGGGGGGPGPVDVGRTPPQANARSGGGGGGGGGVRGNVNNLLGADCRSETRNLPHEKYCDLYYHTTGCGDSQALLRSCPNGLLFTGTGRNGLIGVCDYPHNVNCQGRKQHNPPLSTEHCDWLYGIFGHETSCTRYWTCWNGTATEQFCIGGLLYNEETHACDWPQNVGGCQKHPLCKDDANGNVPLGKSCNRYWACQGGYPRLQRCPAMLVFDKDRKTCVSPPTKDCDVPPTTSPPDDDDLNNGNGNGNRNGNGNGNGKGIRNRGGNGNQGGLGLGLGGGGGDGRRRLAQQQQQQQQPPFQLPEGATLLQRPPNN